MLIKCKILHYWLNQIINGNLLVKKKNDRNAGVYDCNPSDFKPTVTISGTFVLIWFWRSCSAPFACGLLFDDNDLPPVLVPLVKLDPRALFLFIVY